MKMLKEAGIERVFLVPGGGAMYLNDALVQSGIEWVEMFGEQSAGVAAEAHARVTAGLGVAMVTCGPGATNIITAIEGAWIDSIPILVIAGQVKKADLKGFSNLRQKGVQEVDSLYKVKRITKYSAQAEGPLHATYCMRTAIKEAMTPRFGPTWLEVPLDVQGSEL
jgi:acetolactate synthase-1/2/3 large subunit